MFRNLMGTLVLSLGLLTPLADTSRAFAHPGHHHPGCCHHYKVYYRACCCDPWQCCGTYCSYRQACCAADDLRAQGYEVRIR